MSDDLQSKMQRRQENKPNTVKADKIMKDTLVTLLTTSKGWIIRQALKYVGAAMMALTAWTQSKAEALDLPTEQVASTLTAGTSFAMGVTVLVIEMTLSFMARKNR